MLFKITIPLGLIGLALCVLNSCGPVPPSSHESDMMIEHSNKAAIGPDFEAGFLKAHNDARKKIPGIPPLRWDKNIAAFAQAYANTLNCQLRHNPNRKNYGENIASNSGVESNPAKVTALWLSEVRDFMPQTKTCKAGKVCGHYTQVMWKNTTAFGCGVAQCGTGRNIKQVWVCNYSPAGNYIGQKPY